MSRNVCKFENVDYDGKVMCLVGECSECVECIGTDICDLFIDQRTPSCAVCGNSVCINADHRRLVELDDISIQSEDPVDGYKLNSIESDYILGRLTDQIK